MNIHVTVISNKPELSLKMEQQQQQQKPLKKGKGYIGFVAMGTGMCIKPIDRAPDDFEL